MEDIPIDVGEGEVTVRNVVEEQPEVLQEQEDVVMFTGTQHQEQEEQESPLREEANDLEDGRENQEGEAGVLKYPKRKLREPAPVWLCGGQSLPDGTDRCNICGRIFVSETSNTSNLRDHILRKHSKTPEGKKLKKMTDEKRKKLAEMKKKMNRRRLVPNPSKSLLLAL